MFDFLCVVIYAFVPHEFVRLPTSVPCIAVSAGCEGLLSFERGQCRNSMSACLASCSLHFDSLVLRTFAFSKYVYDCQVSIGDLDQRFLGQ